MSKREKIENFLLCLDNYVSDKAQDIVNSNDNDAWDSMVGFSAIASGEKLSAALYDLFDLEE
jgi:hypothetical protein